MKVVLATAPDEWKTKEHLPPLSLAYIASVLEEERHEVVIIDSPVHQYGVEETAREIVEKKPDMVGITATTHNRFSAIELCDQTKKKTSALILVGGPHFSTIARDTLRNVSSIDIVVKGEGESTAKEIVAGKPLGTIAGLAYRDKNGQVVENPRRAFIKNLDSLPMPAWHLLHLKKYSATLEGEYETPAIGVISSRGCPNECVFCVNRAYWRRTLRLRSPIRFVDEVEFLHKQYGYDAFDMWDDTFTINKSHAREICEEIMRRKLNIIWYARARVDTVDEDLLKLMRKAGCHSVSYGVESGSPAILKIIKKNITIAQAKKVIQISARLGFYVKAFFMFSLPGETAREVKDTLRLMDEVANYGAKVSCVKGYTVIYPGTELELLARKQGVLASDFEWNRRLAFEANRTIKANPAVPLYQNPGLPLEDIQQIIDRHQRRLIRLANRGFHRLIQVN